MLTIMSPLTFDDIYRVDITSSNMQTETLEFKGKHRAVRAYDNATHIATSVHVTMKQFMHLGEVGEFIWTQPLKEWRNAAHGS